MPKLLTQAEVNALPNRTKVVVRWSGGNGPFKYEIRRDYGAVFACTEDGYKVGELEFVGGARFHNQVWLDET